jgi:hypothetical protein
VRRNCDENDLFKKKKKILFLSKKNNILFLKKGGMYWKNIIGYEVHYILENISQREIL